MGAWDFGALDNDDAQEFVADLMNTSGDRWRMVETTLALVCDAAGDTECPEECAALAAAEVVAAAASGSSSQGLDEELAEWVMRTAPKHLHMLSQDAVRVVDRIAHNSELHGLWSQAGELRPWLESLQDLKKRLAITIH
jgi:Domain of unknown function (DUF4259)